MHNKKWEVYIIWAQWDVKCAGDRMGKGVLTFWAGKWKGFDQCEGFGKGLKRRCWWASKWLKSGQSLPGQGEASSLEPQGGREGFIIVMGS